MYGSAGITDQAVIEACNGSEPHKAQLAAAIAPQVRAAIVARLGPAPSARSTVDDIWQEVNMALLAGLPNLEKRTATGLQGFVSRITKNKVIDHIRSRARHGGVASPMSLDSDIGDDSDAGPLWQFLSDSGTRVSAAAWRAELIQLARRELADLKDEYREVITLAFFHQLPTSEIASAMGITRPAASMLLMRALKTLRNNIVKANPQQGGSSRA
jgi:RNA polymerase sigma factor (sigma-70 family)